MKSSMMVVLLSLTLSISGCSDPVSNEADESDTKNVENIDDENNVDEEQGEVVEKAEENENSELPQITDIAMEEAESVMMGYDMVKDTHIEINENQINLVLQVNSATNEEHAKELGDNFVRSLASNAAFYSEEQDLEGPSNKYLGEIWDHYNLQIGVGSGPDNFIVQGAMVTTADRITW